MGLNRDGSRDFAYYADDWIWPRTRTDLMKSTLLFFDGLALSLPQSIRRPIDRKQSGTCSATG
jgi:hypothetical protein